ncbi:unnamed protein product [Fusarium langsethiae]|nr:unnamed protein product [Fusarium langsethiae]
MNSAFKNIAVTIPTQNIQGIDDPPLPSSWAEITVLKILFPDDFFVSKHAVAAQEKFPEANIESWKLNEKGPTSARGWKKNPFRSSRQRPGKKALKNKPAQDTTGLLKRPRSSGATEDIEGEANPFKKLRLASQNPAEDVEDAVAGRGTSKQATPSLPDEPGDSEDFNEFWNEFDDKLDTIRRAAKEGTEITPRMLDGLRKAHLDEVKKQHPDEIFKNIDKQHARELRHIRVRYEVVIATWLRGIASGVKCLQSTRRELSMLSDHKE